MQQNLIKYAFQFMNIYCTIELLRNFVGSTGTKGSVNSSSLSVLPATQSYLPLPVGTRNYWNIQEPFLTHEFLAVDMNTVSQINFYFHCGVRKNKFCQALNFLTHSANYFSYIFCLPILAFFCHRGVRTVYKMRKLRVYSPSLASEMILPTDPI